MAKPIALDFGPTALAGLEGEDAEFVALLVVLERGAWVFWLQGFHPGPYSSQESARQKDTSLDIALILAPTPPRTETVALSML